MKAIIAGGRDYKLTSDDVDWLNDVVPLSVNEIVNGGSRGVDSDAIAWAESHGVRIKVFIPDWRTLGPKAGPIRNTAMLDYVGKDVIIVLFPGGRGTDDIRKKSKARGLKVIEREERG